MMAKKSFCNWYQDGGYDGSDTWETSCGHYFTLNEGSPEENEFKFCSFCGGTIKSFPFIEEEVDED